MAILEYDQKKQLMSSTNVDDIRRYRPDLTDEEAMNLLVENERVMNERYGDKGFDWEDLQEFADMQYPEREAFCLVALAENQPAIAVGKLSLRSGEFALVDGVGGDPNKQHVFVVLSGSGLPSSINEARLQPIHGFDGVMLHSSELEGAGFRASMAGIYENMPALLEARAQQIDAMRYVVSVDQLKHMLADRNREFSVIGDDENYLIGYAGGVFTIVHRETGAELNAADSELMLTRVGQAIESGTLKCWDDMSWMFECPIVDKNTHKPKP